MQPTAKKLSEGANLAAILNFAERHISCLNYFWWFNICRSAKFGFGEDISDHG